MSAGKSASRPLLPVEETIRTRTLMNCEFRYHAHGNHLMEDEFTPTTDSSRLFWSRYPSDGKLLHISFGRRNSYRSAMTEMWDGPGLPLNCPGPFNLDWYMTYHHTVANVKKFVGEFH